MLVPAGLLHLLTLAQAELLGAPAMTPPTAPPASPASPAVLCSNGCEGNPSWASDGWCDDGGPGAEYSGCAFGSDCEDCGPRKKERQLMPPDPAPPTPPLAPALCDDSCANSTANGLCEDGGMGSDDPPQCALGTDCSDCGPRVFVRLSPPNAPSRVEVTVEGQCSLSPDGTCVRSPNFRHEYFNSQTCHVRGLPLVPLEVVFFSTEAKFDYVTVNGIQYSGDEGPDGVIPMDGTLKWVSDSSFRMRGWEICWVHNGHHQYPPLPPSPSPPPPPPPPPQQSPIVIVLLAALTGLLGFFMCIMVAWFLRRQRRQHQAEHDGPVTSDASQGRKADPFAPTRREQICALAAKLVRRMATLWLRQQPCVSVAADSEPAVWVHGIKSDLPTSGSGSQLLRICAASAAPEPTLQAQSGCSSLDSPPLKRPGRIRLVRMAALSRSSQDLRKETPLRSILAMRLRLRSVRQPVCGTVNNSADVQQTSSSILPLSSNSTWPTVSLDALARSPASTSTPGCTPPWPPAGMGTAAGIPSQQRQLRPAASSVHMDRHCAHAMMSQPIQSTSQEQLHFASSLSFSGLCFELDVSPPSYFDACPNAKLV